MIEIRIPVEVPLGMTTASDEVPMHAPTIEYYVLEYCPERRIYQHPTTGRVVVKQLFDEHREWACAFLRGLIK